VDNFRQDALFLRKYVAFLSSVIQNEAGTIFRNSYFLRKYPISGVSKKTLFFLLHPIIKLHVSVCLSSNRIIKLHVSVCLSSDPIIKLHVSVCLSSNPIIKLRVSVCLSSNLTLQIHDFCNLCTDKSIRNALS